jgi:hypothetical protein
VRRLVPGGQPSGHGSGMDSWSSPRYRFDGTCPIAPSIREQLPRELEFLSVKGYNSSHHGFVEADKYGLTRSSPWQH